jgi:H+/Cl- antiporter ClcA
VLRETEEQSEGVPIGRDGVRARTSMTLQSVAEKRLEQRRERKRQQAASSASTSASV